MLLLRRIAIKPSRARYLVRFNSTNVPDKRGTSPTPEKKTEYVPKATYQRVTYEYPPPPDPEPFKPVEASAFRKHLPLLAAVGGIAWAAYAYKHFISDSEREQQSHLDPSHFVTFKLTYREELTNDLAIIELAPKYETFQKFIRQKGSFWNGKKLWSVDVKQPEIQVVRKYTPLPMYYQQYYDADGKNQALLRMIGGSEEDEGRFTMLVKKYDDGEVSRYLHRLPIGSEVEIRGPFVGYKFPYAPIDSTPLRDPMQDLPSRMLPEYPLPEGVPPPDNIAFFAAGTGIAPILQSLLSFNPPRGKVDVYFSTRDRKEIPFSRFMLFLEKTGRAKFHYFIDNEDRFLSLKDIPQPVAKQHDAAKKVDDKVAKSIEQANEELSKEPEIGPRRKYRSVVEQTADMPPDTRGPAIAVVCGPEGYINYVAGPRGAANNEPIRGLLGAKDWDSTNAVRMES